MKTIIRLMPVRLVLAALIVAPASAQRNDVTFFVIGKHANFDQDPSGKLAPVDFSFFSEIFLTGDGDASAATLRFPGGEMTSFEDMRLAEGGSRDNLLLVAGADRYKRIGDLQARYPDGDYRVSFDTPSGDVDATLTFQPRPLPTPPVITVQQDGRACLHLDPERDITVGWTPFEEGRPDPNGILDDLIFVILTDEDGMRVAHSGRPFENRPYLTYAETTFTVDRSALAPGRRYELSVEHALLDDTTAFDGVPGFTTRAVTTRLDVGTAATSGGGCAATREKS